MFDLLRIVLGSVRDGITKWREAKKTELEIEELESKKKDRQAVIRVATENDIVEFDEKTNTLIFKIKGSIPIQKASIEISGETIDVSIDASEIKLD